MVKTFLPCFDHQAAAIVRNSTVQATAAHAEAEGLAGAGRHNEAEAAAAAAQRWLRRAAQAAQ